MRGKNSTKFLLEGEYPLKTVVVYSHAMKKQTKTAWPWLFLTAFLILLDQVTKHWVLLRVTPLDDIPIFPFLNIVLRLNSGAAFSFLGGQDGWQVYFLAAVSLVVSVMLVIWLARLPRGEWWIACPVSMVLGGAVGNLIDRIQYHYVVDFIDFHLGAWHFATFNIADAAVSVGATWLIARVVYEGLVGES